MAKDILGGSENSGLTPEQIKKLAGQEAYLADMQAQANLVRGADGLPYSEKEMRKGIQYETEARNAARAGRVEANLARANAIDTSSLNQNIADAQTAIDAANAASAGAATATTAAENSPGYAGAPVDTAAYDSRVSAFNVLKQEFERYGLGSLVDGIKGLIQENVPASEFTLRLQQTPEYQKRFAANADRIKAGLQALTPAEYIGLEDQYQGLMRNYGLPESYYSKDATGTQAGLNKLIANDVSAAELEDRIATAQQRVLNSNPEVLKALKQFYPDLSNADILAYTLDPKNGLDAIKRKVTAAEIGGAALQQGLQANGGTAESLAGQGITKAQAQQGYANVAEMAPRGSELASIYGQQPYDQSTAEAEVFNTAGAADAARRRKKLTELETANFSGQSGVGYLGRDKSNPYGITQSGYGQY